MEGLRLETELRHQDTLPVLAVRGEIDVYTAPVFKQAVQSLLAEGHTQLIIDMTGVNFMDSSGFAALLEATKRLRPQGGELHLAGVNRTVGRMLHLTRLDAAVALHSTVGQAIAAAAALKGARAGARAVV